MSCCTSNNNESISILNKTREAAVCAQTNCASAEESAEAAALSAYAAAVSAGQAAASAALSGIYLGPKATAPTTDNEGNPLQEGMQYFNTTDSVLYIWNGTAWQSSAFNEFTNFTATGSLSSENLVNRFEDIDKVKDFPSYNFLAAGSVTPENLQDRFEDIDKVKDFPSYNFLATGTTTPRDLVTRMADVVNVKDFGAVGDGVTDDIAAFVLAADTGKQVLVPDGTYTITTSTLVQVNSILLMLSRLHLFCNQLTINIGSGQFVMPSQTELNVTNPDRLIISGANPIATTITTISNVTGSAGSWSVTANVNSSTGIAIGDLVTVKNVKPGVQAPGTYTTRPVKGALQMQLFQNGELTLASTIGSVTGSTLSTYVNAGDFLECISSIFIN
jgi:hypothetical protein